GKEATETEQVYQEDRGVEKCFQSAVLTEELMKAYHVKEAEEEEVHLSPDEEEKNMDEDLTGAAAELVEVNENTGGDKKEHEIAVAEAKNAQLEEKLEEQEMANDTHLENR
ncbi:unnamed protein product, partial [Musa hybrid cultivar]